MFTDTIVQYIEIKFDIHNVHPFSIYMDYFWNPCYQLVETLELCERNQLLLF